MKVISGLENNFRHFHGNTTSYPSLTMGMKKKQIITFSEMSILRNTFFKTPNIRILHFQDHIFENEFLVPKQTHSN